MHHEEENLEIEQGEMSEENTSPCTTSCQLCIQIVVEPTLFITEAH